jgi:hypothetical protein
LNILRQLIRWVPSAAGEYRWVELWRENYIVAMVQVDEGDEKQEEDLKKVIEALS